MIITAKQQSFFSGYSMKFYYKSQKRIVKVWCFILCLIIVCGNLSAKRNDFVKIVDGDSLEIGKRRIRLIGIDAPEYGQYCFDNNKNKYNCGADAFSYLAKKIKTANYDVRCDVVKNDRYGRELAECFVLGENLNLEMLREGWAVTYRADDEMYFNAENSAKDAQKGLWRGKFMRPEYYRKLHKYKK